jgi:hypothetical protein
LRSMGKYPWLKRRTLMRYRGMDNNVPVWHTRELVGLVQSWNQSADITYIIFYSKS